MISNRFLKLAGLTFISGLLIRAEAKPVDSLNVTLSQPTEQALNTFFPSQQIELILESDMALVVRVDLEITIPEGFNRSEATQSLPNRARDFTPGVQETFLLAKCVEIIPNRSTILPIDGNEFLAPNILGRHFIVIQAVAASQVEQEREICRPGVRSFSEILRHEYLLERKIPIKIVERPMVQGQ